MREKRRGAPAWRRQGGCKNPPGRSVPGLRVAHRPQPVLVSLLWYPGQEWKITGRQAARRHARPGIRRDHGRPKGKGGLSGYAQVASPAWLAHFVSSARPTRELFGRPIACEI